MTTMTLRQGTLEAKVSTSGGSVRGLWWDTGAARIPLLREAADMVLETGEETAGPTSACFPLVPFCNRVRGNRFIFGGNTYDLAPNTPGDPHYLHGDGWLSRWTIITQTSSAATLGFSYAGPETPYVYDALQTFTLSNGVFSLSMTVTNRGQEPLPFGIGWHPFFPMTPRTTLKAPARTFRTEAPGWLPGDIAAFPEDLDFDTHRPLPRRWVNNGFEDWSGRAEIVWPERDTGLVLTADPVLRHAYVFISDTRFDPTFRNDVFCFEPMSHRADGQNRPDLGDLTVLQPGESLVGSLRLQPGAARGIDGKSAIP